MAARGGARQPKYSTYARAACAQSQAARFLYTRLVKHMRLKPYLLDAKLHSFITWLKVFAQNRGLSLNLIFSSKGKWRHELMRNAVSVIELEILAITKKRMELYVALLDPLGVDDCHALLHKIGEAYNIDLKSQMDMVVSTWLRNQRVEKLPIDAVTEAERHQIMARLWESLPATANGKITESPQIVERDVEFSPVEPSSGVSIEQPRADRNITRLTEHEQSFNEHEMSHQQDLINRSKHHNDTNSKAHQTFDQTSKVRSLSKISRPRAGTKNKILRVANEREEWLQEHNRIPAKIKTIRGLDCGKPSSENGRITFMRIGIIRITIGMIVTISVMT
jgi:hypothetical protein